jgi:hypothetical protein
LLAVSVVALSWLSYLPRYSVSSILVVGTDKVSPEAIRAYVEQELHPPGYHFFAPYNIFIYKPSVLNKAVVAAFPQIASATISHDSVLSTSITVTVTERDQFAVWCSNSSHTDCFQLDATGFIFAPAASVPATGIDATSTDSIAAVIFSQQSLRYVFEGGVGSTTTGVAPIGQTFVGAHMPAIVALLKVLGQSGFTPTGAIVKSDQDFFVPLAQGFYIKASFGEDPESVASNLHLVLSSDALTGKENQLEYVDLRFGDRVYYKLQGVDQAQTSK